MSVKCEMRFSVETVSFNKEKEQIQVLTKLLFKMEDVSKMLRSKVKRPGGTSPQRNSLSRPQKPNGPALKRLSYKWIQANSIIREA